MMHAIHKQEELRELAQGATLLLASLKFGYQFGNGRPDCCDVVSDLSKNVPGRL